MSAPMTKAEERAYAQHLRDEGSESCAAASLALMLYARNPAEPPHGVALDAVRLLRLSRRSDSLATAECNGTLPACKRCGGSGEEPGAPTSETARAHCLLCDGNGTTYHKRAERIALAASEIVAPYFLTANSGGDPRGFTLKLFALNGSAPLRGNTWGGDESGYAVVYGRGR